MQNSKKAWTKPEIWQIKVTPAEIAVLFPTAKHNLSNQEIDQRRAALRSAVNRHAR
jgi:hypothetical protein